MTTKAFTPENPLSVKDELNNRPTESTSKVRNFKESVKENFDDLKPSAEETFQTAKERFSDMASNLSQRGKDLSHNIDEQVRQNPWSFIGGVALGSLLLGYILGRRS